MQSKIYQTVVICLLMGFNSALCQGRLYDIMPMEDGKVTYSAVINIDSTDKEEIYRRAKKWIVDNYNSANDVIQYDDKNEGEIISKGIFETSWQATFMHTYKVKVPHTIKIQVKDGRYRYEISNLRVKYYMPADRYSRAVDGDDPIEEFNKAREKNAAKFIANVDSNIKTIIESLVAGIKKPTKKDW